MFSLIAVSLTVLVLGWTLLVTTSASLLLPNSRVAKAQFWFAVQPTTDRFFIRQAILRRLIMTYIVTCPLFAYLWVLDEMLYGDYHQVTIEKPLITISLPRAGTTSFHRTLALDDRFVTPSILELVMPFSCVHRIVYALAEKSPNVLHSVERLLKWLKGVTPEVEVRHPVGLLLPDADDILLGEWHGNGVGAVKGFPSLQHWELLYSSIGKRSMKLHQVVCQKILHHRACHGKKRLLLRSHLSTCIDDFQQLYPDATFVGILRDPVSVLRSFAGLANCIVETDWHGYSMLKSGQDWPKAFVAIVQDMMGREANLFQSNESNNTAFVPFSQFKKDPVAAVSQLYRDVGLDMTAQFKDALLRNKEAHDSYKERQQYTNPTLADMGVDETAYRSISNVQRYVALLSKGESRISK